MSFGSKASGKEPSKTSSFARTKSGGASLSGSLSRALFAQSLPQVPMLYLKGDDLKSKPPSSGSLSAESSVSNVSLASAPAVESTAAIAPLETVQQADQKATSENTENTEKDYDSDDQSTPRPATPNAPIKPTMKSWRIDLDPIPCLLQQYQDEDSAADDSVFCSPVTTPRKCGQAEQAAEDVASPESCIPFPRTPDAPQKVKPTYARRAEVEPIPCNLLRFDQPIAV
eukprot:scaffold6672_cov40-Prasinocladus_malaysianus.AAC.1